MRPRIPEIEKRKIVIKLLLNQEEKLLLDSFVKRGRYACTSDYVRIKYLINPEGKSSRLTMKPKQNCNDWIMN